MLPSTGHSNGLVPRWVILWPFRCSALVNDLPQPSTGQVNLRSSSCFLKQKWKNNDHSQTHRDEALEQKQHVLSIPNNQYISECPHMVCLFSCFIIRNSTLIIKVAPKPDTEQLVSQQYRNRWISKEQMKQSKLFRSVLSKPQTARRHRHRHRHTDIHTHRGGGVGGESSGSEKESS